MASSGKEKLQTPREFSRWLRKWVSRIAWLCKGKNCSDVLTALALWALYSAFLQQPRAPGENLGVEILPGRCCLSSLDGCLGIFQVFLLLVQGLVWVYISVKIRVKSDPGIILVPGRSQVVGTSVGQNMSPLIFIKLPTNTLIFLPFMFIQNIPRKYFILFYIKRV